MSNIEDINLETSQHYCLETGFKCHAWCAPATRPGEFDGAGNKVY